MELKLSKDYKVTTDSMNYILQQRYEKKDGSGDGYKVMSYFPNLSLLADSVFEMQLKNSKAKTLKQLEKELAAFKDEVIKSIENAGFEK